MILRSIRVEGWRCFPAPVEVGPFIGGLNIIHGPNGAGKSTLMTALARGLFDCHTAGGAVIKSLRPWGRSLNPKVTIEFEQDGEQFQLHKQFLSSASAQLCGLENERYVPIAESRAADERARELLAGEAPAKGASDQRHWGLAQILWATQGSLQIDQLAAGTRATIQDALDAQIAGPGSETVEKRVADAYGQFFTATGKLKSGAAAPAIVGLESQLEEVRGKRAMLQQRLDEFDAASRRIEDLRSQTNSARHSERELSEQLKKAREQEQAYNELLSQCKLHNEKLSAAVDRYKSLDDKIKTIATTRGEVKSANAQLQSLEADAPVQAKQVEQCRAQAEQSKERVEQIRRRRGEVQSARQTAHSAERFTSAKQSLADLVKLLGQIECAQSQRDQLRSQRDQIVAPSAKTLQQIKKTARTRDDARLKLDAAVITVRLTPESDTEVEITAAEVVGKQSLKPLTTHTIKGSPDVALRIPGVAKLEATGPTENVDQLRQQWEQACNKLNDLIAGFGTQDLDRLEQLHSEAADLDGQVSRADLRIRTLLDDRTLDAIRSEQGRASSVVDEILAKFPNWRDTRPDSAALAQEAADAERQFTDDIDAAESKNDLAQEALNLALQKQTGLESDLKNARQNVEEINKRLNALCDDGMTDAERSAKLTEIALDRDAAQGKLAQADEQLASFGDDPTKLVGVLEGQLSAVRQEASDAAEQLNITEGRLQQIIAEAPYSALAAVEEEINRLQEEVARQRLQIDAIRLLYETLIGQKRDVLQSILGPIRLRANHILQRIAGTRFDNVHFDESLLPSGISPKSVDEVISLDQISGGEREQVHFAVRMALADVAFNNERQLLVLDDVFTYTDTTRLARIATILDEAADRFQIVLLTCHPERYRGLPNAKFFDLEQLRTSQDGAAMLQTS